MGLYTHNIKKDLRILDEKYIMIKVFISIAAKRAMFYLIILSIFRLSFANKRKSKHLHQKDVGLFAYLIISKLFDTIVIANKLE